MAIPLNNGSVTAEDIFDKAPDIDHRSIGGEGFIVSPGQAEVHALNPVAALIFEQLDGRHTVGEVLASVVDEFEVTPEVAERDVMAFLLLLEGKGLASRC